MVFFENLLIIAGIGLDVFAAFEIQGAMMAQVKKRALVIACAVVACLELLFYFGGYFISRLLVSNEYIPDPEKYGEVVVVIVLALLGVRLLIKAVKREFIHEKRRDSLLVWDYIRILIVSCIYTLFAGASSGLIGISAVEIIIIILVISIIMVIGGFYTGIHFGFENKTLAYIGGTLLLWGAAVEILLRRVLEIL